MKNSQKEPRNDTTVLLAFWTVSLILVSLKPYVFYLVVNYLLVKTLFDFMAVK